MQRTSILTAAFHRIKCKDVNTLNKKIWNVWPVFPNFSVNFDWWKPLKNNLLDQFKIEN